ncbi:MAG: aldo/keto reductase [Saprospiraceae bacterium]|nr:aldo/keto reductase [Saprospiraceae bacterium]
MQYRRLGKTGFDVSEIGLGTWQLGGKWGTTFDEKTAEKILETSIDQGINFLDTADVYNSGLSEKAIGKALRRHKQRIFVATKCGRQIKPHVDEGYQPSVLRRYVEESLQRMKVEKLDLVQLHCPPTQVYYRPEIFELFDRLKDEGKILNLGVSVQKVEEALKSIEFDNVTSVQLIFNVFRQRPAERFFTEAHKKNVGIIVRVPLASGLLSGKFNRNSQFDKEDHRHFNREGARFDRGETFSGIPFEKGIDIVAELENLLPGRNLVHTALQWILTYPEISTIIPGASRPEQVIDNIKSLSAPPLTTAEKEKIDGLYEVSVKRLVHQRW